MPGEKARPGLHAIPGGPSTGATPLAGGGIKAAGTRLADPCDPLATAASGVISGVAGAAITGAHLLVWRPPSWVAPRRLHRTAAAPAATEAELERRRRARAEDPGLRALKARYGEPDADEAA